MHILNLHLIFLWNLRIAPVSHLFEFTATPPTHSETRTDTLTQTPLPLLTSLLCKFHSIICLQIALHIFVRETGKHKNNGKKTLYLFRHLFTLLEVWTVFRHIIRWDQRHPLNTNRKGGTYIVYLHVSWYWLDDMKVKQARWFEFSFLWQWVGSELQL